MKSIDKRKDTAALEQIGIKDNINIKSFSTYYIFFYLAL